MSKQASDKVFTSLLFCLVGMLLSTTASTDGHTVPERPCGWFSEYVSYEVKRSMNYINCLKDGVITVRVYR